jgi:hypothetical protein
MNVRVANEVWIFWSFVQPSESGTWTWIWISSWDPLKLCDAIRRTTLSPARVKPGRARPPKRAFATSSHLSNAPIKPISQSNLSKIIALLTAILASIRSIRIAFCRTGRLLLGPHQRAERLALSGDPVDQTRGIQQRSCLIQELLVSRATSSPFS